MKLEKLEKNDRVVISIVYLILTLKVAHLHRRDGTLNESDNIFTLLPRVQVSSPKS